MSEHIRTLTERRDYLSLRIKAKASMGWENTYDQREHDALAWAIEQLALHGEHA